MQTSLTKIRFLAVLVLGLSMIGVIAAPRFVTDFNSGVPAGSAVFGNARVDSSGGVGNSGVLKLTDAVASQQGGFIIYDFNSGQPVTQFVAQMKIHIGDGTARPADGFSFNFGSDIPDGSFGEDGVGSGIRVTMDTWDNNDPDTAPAMELVVGGVAVAFQSMAGEREGGRAPAGPFITDPATGAPMTLRNAAGEYSDLVVRLEADKTIDVIYKGVVIFNNVATSYTPVTGGKFAFGARTGGATDNQWVDNIDINLAAASGAPVILTQPASLTANENSDVGVSVVADGAPLLSYQWLAGGSPIPGATGSTLSGKATYDLNGVPFTVRVSNAQGSVDSAAAVLTVIPDLTRPVLVSAATDLRLNKVIVNYSEAVNPATATASGNYSIQNGGSTYAVLGGIMLKTNQVELTTVPLPESTTFTLVVNDVQDLAAAGNKVAPNSTATFASPAKAFKRSYFTFDGLSLPAGTAAYGSTRQDSGILKINDAVNGVSGTYIISDLLNGQPMVQFSMQADIRIGDSACCTAGRNELRPADGMSINFANDLPNDGWSGGALEEGAGSGLRLTLDTWDSGDPDTAPAIELVYNGATKAAAPLAGWRDNNIPATGIVPNDPQNGTPLTLYTDARDVTFAQITSGPAAGTIHLAHQGDLSLDLSTLPDGTLAGPTVYVGDACDPALVPVAPAPGAIALAQRGTCTFELKSQNCAAAGYAGMLLFNDAARGEDHFGMGMGTAAAIPAVMIAHSAGLQVAGVASAAELVVGNAGADVALKRTIAPVAPYGQLVWTLDPDGTSDVWWKGVKIIDNVQTGYQPIAGGRFGIGGRTGGANESHWVDNLLINLYGSSGPATILQQPQPLTVVENRAATFEVIADGTMPISYQWFAGGAAIPGATGPVLTQTASLANDGLMISVRVSNAEGSATSQEVRLTVLADSFPPQVASVMAESTYTDVVVEFDETVAEDAIDPFLYSLERVSDGYVVPVVAAESASPANAPLTKIRLKTKIDDQGEALDFGTAYRLIILGVNDIAVPPNALETTVEFTTPGATPGYAFRQIYLNIGGVLVSDLTNNPAFPNSPNASCYISTWEFNQADEADNYGARITGYFIPQVSGDYTFYVSADDQAYHYLSTDSTPGNKVLICQEPVWAGRREWTGNGSGGNRGGTPNISAPIPLVAGQAYYMESLMKEGGGGDNLAVNVSGPGIPVPANGSPAMGGVLIGVPAIPTAGATLAVTLQPVSTSGNENQTATFTAAAAAVNAPCGAVVTYQWRKNGVFIPGATGASYTTPPLKLADDQAAFDVLARIPGLEVASAAATLTVIPDTQAPTLVSASGMATDLTVTFSEAMDPVTALDPTKYTLTDASGFPVQILSGSFVNPVAANVVFLITARQNGGTAYTLTVNGIKDGSAAGNVIAAGSQAFYSTPFEYPGTAFIEYWTGIGGTAVNDLLNNPRYPNQPDAGYTCLLGAWAMQRDRLDNYGARVRALFTAPETGAYRFYIRSDDASRLWLNPNGASPDGKIPIAEETGCCGNFSKIQSGTYNLQAGRVYYLEGVVKEGGGGDFFDAAFKLESDPTGPDSLSPIPGAYLTTIWAPATGASVVITQDPVDVSSTENEFVTFTAAASVNGSLFCGASGAKVQWRLNGVAIPGATQPTYERRLLLSDNGAKIDFVAMIPGAQAVSLPATLTVVADNKKPQIASAASANGREIGVRFTELVTADAADAFVWVVDGGAAQAGTAALVPAGATESRELLITLGETSPSVAGTFALECNNLVDLAGNVNDAATGTGVRWLESVDPLGTPNPPGTHFTAAEGEIQITTGGADMWDTTDSGTFAWKRVYGNFDINARVDRLDYVGSSWSKAGINVRKSLSPNSQVLAWIYPNPTTGANQVEYARRLSDGSGISDVGQPRPNVNNFPIWVRVRRVGDVVTGYHSRDGVNWVNQGGDQVVSGYGVEMLMGLALTPNVGNDGRATTAEYFFSNTILYPNAVVTVTGPADQTVDDLNYATFTVGATVVGAPASELWYLWEEETAAGSGEFSPVGNTATLTKRVTLADSGKHYRVTVSAGGSGAVTSRAALLTVIPDVNPPYPVLAQGSVTFDTIKIRFNEGLSVIGSPFEYEVQGPGGSTVEVGVVGPGANDQEVILSLNAMLQPDTDYTVVIPGGVFDLSNIEVAANTSISFRSFTLTPGFARREIYFGIGGVLVSDLVNNPKYPYSPDLVNYNTLLEGVTDTYDNYGIRVSGFLRPKTSGVFDFYMSADDGAEFWLSTDASPANKVLICREPVWNGSRDWLGTARRDAANPENRSLRDFPDGISLTAGQLYYYEALMKEGGGGDNLGVAVATHGGTPPANGSSPVPGAFNLVVGADQNGASINITQQPKDVVVGINCGASGAALVSEDFNAGNGGFVGVSGGDYLNAVWTYDSASGSWTVNGNHDPCGSPGWATLTSPTYTITRAGQVGFSLSHRYSFEGDFWDGGQIRMSKNGGPFTTVPGANLQGKGYDGVLWQGNTILKNQEGFNADSPGYTTPAYVETSGTLGSFNEGDTVAIQFVGGWDECSIGKNPNWQINALTMAQGIPVVGPAPVTFSVAATGAITGNSNHPLFVQWQKNGADIEGANSLTYSVQVTEADAGSQFRALLYVPGAGVVSSAGTVIYTEAPQVAVTSPADGSSVSTCSPVTIVASATDPDGTVVKVGFFAEGIGLLGEDTNGADGWSLTIPQAPVGVYVVTAVATDNLGVPCASAPVVVTVVSQAPICVAGSAVVNEDGMVNIMLMASDDDAVLTYAVVDGPMHGAVSLVGNVATYMPAPNYCGPDSFTFKATDPCGNASSACMVAIDVIGVPDAPVCAAASATGCEDQPIVITLPASDPDLGSCLPDSHVWTIVTGPANGTVSIAGNVATYQGTAEFSGTDSFTYQVTDMYGLASGVCTVSVTVTIGNDSPVGVVKVMPTVDLGPSVPGVNVMSPNNIGACVTLDATQSSDVDNDFSDLTFTWMVNGVAVGTGPVLPDVCLLVGDNEVKLIVNDGTMASGACDEPAESETVQMVTVLSGMDASEELINQIYDSMIERKNKQQFIATCKTAAAAFERGSFGAGLNMLEALINKFEAQLDGNPDIQEQWIKEVQSIIEGMSQPVTCDGCME